LDLIADRLRSLEDATANRDASKPHRYDGPARSVVAACQEVFPTSQLIGADRHRRSRRVVHADAGAIKDLSVARGRSGVQELFAAPPLVKEFG
jgi:hypothetical protein